MLGREKGTAAAAARVRAWAFGPPGCAWAAVLRTKYGTRREREEREKEADNKQGKGDRRTDDSGGGGER